MSGEKPSPLIVTPLEIIATSALNSPEFEFAFGAFLAIKAKAESGGPDMQEFARYLAVIQKRFWDGEYIERLAGLVGPCQAIAFYFMCKDFDPVGQRGPLAKISAFAALHYKRCPVCAGLFASREGLMADVAATLSTQSRGERLD